MITRQFREKPNKEQRSLLKRAAIYLGGLVLIIVLAFVITNRFYSETQNTQIEQTIQQHNSLGTTLVKYNGQEYYPKTGLTTVLFMGIDRTFDENEEITSARNGGQADFLALFILDADNNTIKRLQIDRDTMTKITVLGVFGNKTGSKTLQICLSHGYGDGQEQSCELTVEAVKQLLFGIQINEYIAVDLDGIGAINDVLGGVSVPIENDFSFYDVTMVPGTVMKLTAQQAEYYVRKRANIGEETNESRMLRQSIYIKNGANQARALMQADKNYADSFFNAIEPYITTSMNKGRMINLINSIIDYNYDFDPLIIQGEYTSGVDNFVEFYAEEDALYQLVLSTFYEIKH